MRDYAPILPSPSLAISVRLAEKERPNNNLSAKAKTIKLLQGSEAAAEGALAAGMRFFAGYPITPANEISEILSERLPKLGGIFIQMEDEIASLAAVIGASLGGVKAATATSGPGFSLMQENIGYAAAAEIPCVIIDVQRTGPSTGRPTSPSQGDVMQARWGSHGDYPIIALSPSSVAETYRLAIRAFNLSEKYRTPVILLMDELIGHIRERVELLPPKVTNRPQTRVPPQDYLPYDDTWSDVPPWASFGSGYHYYITGLSHDRTGFPTQRPAAISRWLERLFHKIEGNLDDIVEIEEEGTTEAEVAMVAYGATARSARHAMRLAQEKGEAVGLVKLLTLWPFPYKEIERLAGQVSRIVVVEMNRGQMLQEVEKAAKGKAEVKGINRADGELIDPYHIVEALKAK